MSTIITKGLGEKQKIITQGLGLSVIYAEPLFVFKKLIEPLIFVKNFITTTVDPETLD